MSDPRALVIDYFDPRPTLYVGPNGGWAVLKIDIETFTIVGYPLCYFISLGFILYFIDSRDIKPFRSTYTALGAE
jgi:hypothetical protein